eukprot:158472_1
MTSITSKSLIISQGVEWKSYFFCWLCVCTDFFSVFFIVSWIFVSNEYINADFLGNFSLIAEIWCIKMAVAIVLPIACMPIFWFAFAMWCVIYVIFNEMEVHCCCKFVFLFLFLTLGNALAAILYCMFAFLATLFAEILSFSFVAVFIWGILTVDNWNYTDQVSANAISEFLFFVSNGSNKHNDKLIRISSINFAYNPQSDLAQYILQRKQDETLHQLTYQNIRDHSRNPEDANLFKDIFQAYCTRWQGTGWHRWNENPEKFAEVIMETAGYLLLYISFPIYMLSRVVTVVYPYFIIGYITYYHLWFKMNIFELAMLGIYVLLQMITVILGFFVVRTHMWLWHIMPGMNRYRMELHKLDINAFLKRLYHFYDSIQWMPITKGILVEKFGKDIGEIIVSYL